MYHPLSLNGYSKIINAVKRQRNLGLNLDTLETSAVFVYIMHVVTIYEIDAVANEIDVVLKIFDSGMKIQDFN
jgi:hypothetical protein